MVPSAREIATALNKELGAPNTIVTVPKPGELDASKLHERCAAIETWAARSEDLGALHNARAGLAAIDEYLLRTTHEGRSRVAAAIRRLEVRIGKLLGPARVGSNQHAEPSFASEGSLTANERSQFRKMADHNEIVEEVISGSDDDAVASRGRVLRAIRETQRGPKPERPRHDLVRILETVVTSCDHALGGFGVEEFAAALGELEPARRDRLHARLDPLIEKLVEIRRANTAPLRRVQ